MDTDAVGRWVKEYERAWRECDAPAVRDLFTEDAHYLTSPYEKPLVGHEAIEDFWNDPQPFDMFHYVSLRFRMLRRPSIMMCGGRYSSYLAY